LAQFWYSPNTIKVLTEVCADCKCVGLLSTPFVFFALSEDMQKKAVLFEYDRKWEEGNNRFRFFDYHAPTADIDVAFWGKCDLAIADPPLILPNVVDKYMEVIKLILAPGGRIVLSSAMENEHRLLEDHGLFARDFVPKASAVWAEVGRFRLYTNFGAECLGKRNLVDFPGGTGENDYSEEACGWTY